MVEVAVVVEDDVLLVDGRGRDEEEGTKSIGRDEDACTELKTSVIGLFLFDVVSVEGDGIRG
jgi:hypothetical protein